MGCSGSGDPHRNPYCVLYIDVDNHLFWCIIKNGRAYGWIVSPVFTGVGGRSTSAVNTLAVADGVFVFHESSLAIDRLASVV